LWTPTYITYKNSTHPACKIANAEASKAIHQSRRNFEHRLGCKIKDDKKSFFAYARCKAKTKIRVGPIVSPDGKEIKDVTQIAKKFNDQFSSVFTAENMTDIPVPTNIFTGSYDDKLCDIIFTEGEVLKRLLSLREDKSAGVDEMSSRFIKAVCHEITVPVTILLIYRCQNTKFLMIGSSQMLRLYINKEAEVVQKTIDLSA